MPKSTDPPREGVRGMIANPVSVGKGGAEITQVKVVRTGYETDWTITIGGAEHMLTKGEETLPYQEGQKIDLKGTAKTTALTVGGGQILLELGGGAIGAVVPAT